MFANKGVCFCNSKIDCIWDKLQRSRMTESKLDEKTVTSMKAGAGVSPKPRAQGLLLGKYSNTSSILCGLGRILQMEKKTCK